MTYCKLGKKDCEKLFVTLGTQRCRVCGCVISLMAWVKKPCPDTGV